MQEVSRGDHPVGIDLAEIIHQVPAISGDECAVVCKASKCAQVEPFFLKLARWPVGAETCGTTHHWPREL